MFQPRDSFFWQMALRSGLVDDARLRECWDAIPPDRRTSDWIDRRLARQMVEAGHLTSWQAQQVTRGRGDRLRIDKYLLLDMIGQGGMGRVFLARDTRLNRRVALKVLSQDRRNDAKAIDRFRREARLGAQLQHENLVRVYDEGAVNGHCYLVMEYIEGSSVAQLLAGHGPMPTSTASRLARQVALALEHARQKGMIHRDVNPHNLLVTRDGTVKLTDLGLAIELGDGDNLTLDGALVGNYDYISPEQVRHSRDVDTRSDIYSLGCTLYHMVAGRVPFPCSTLPEKVHAQLTADPPPLSSRVPGVPEGFDEVVSRMMRKAPEERYPDPMAVARALEPFIEGEAFSGLAGAASALYTRPDRPDDSLTPTRVFPPVPATDGGAEPTAPAGEGFPLSASTSNVHGPASDLPPTEPGGITRTTTSEDAAPALNAGPRPPSSFLSSGSREFRSIGSWIARSRPSGPRGRVAGVSLLAATILTSSLLMTKPWRRGPEVAPDLGPPTRSSAEARRDASRDFLAVSLVHEDGTESPALDLRDALQSGGGGDLRIVLRGRGPDPIRLEAEALVVRSGTVTIGADPAARPTLVVDLSGPEPFLKVKTRANLKLEGLAIQVEYGGQGGRVAPLIEVKGTLELDRCAFWTTEQVAASRAVTSEGLRLSATGCWFGGFRQCLDVAAFAGTEVVLEQCMMIRSPGSDPSDSWAVRVRHEPTHAAENSRRLSFRRCTVRDACLLRADDFHPSAPLEVTILETAVQAGALLAWKSESDLVKGCLDWTGHDNLYDLPRAARAIRLDGPPAAPGGSTASDAWDKLMDERRSLDRPIWFSDPASSNQGDPRPEDFPTQEKDGVPVGATPGKVGPAPGPDARGPALAEPTRGG